MNLFPYMIFTSFILLYDWANIFSIIEEIIHTSSFYYYK